MGQAISARIGVSTVDALAPGDIVRDTEVKGFGVRRRDGAPSYFLQTRVKGRLRWITIGTHGSPWTPALARKEALRLLGKIHEGQDPASAKQAERLAPTLNEASERFLREHGARLKPRTLVEYTRLLRTVIKPALGRRLLADITPADVTTVHGKHAKTPRNANFALAVLSALMSWAEESGLRPADSNPCKRVKRFPEAQRQRFLTDPEITELGKALDQIDRDGTETPHVVAAIRLLLLTGCRLSEILTLKWQHVDLQRGLLLLPDSKTGQKTVFLNDDAKTVLGNVPRLTENPFVIVGVKHGQRLGNIHAPWQRILQKAGLADLRIHDLRHSFASIAAANGASLLFIGKLLGHTSPQTTQRYAHLVADPVKELNEKIGAILASRLKTE